MVSFFCVIFVLTKRNNIMNTFINDIKKATTRVEIEHITRKAIISSDISKREYDSIIGQAVIRIMELGL